MKNFLITTFILSAFITQTCYAQDVPEQFKNPPREFSVMPFWFWNDTLKADELLRQIADFDEHGVYGFVIHPRMGLPKDMRFLSPEMLSLMKVAIEEAERRNMKVILYDEGSYPSGSAEGQVVEKNPEHAARGLARIVLKPGETPKLEKGWKLVTIVDPPNGERFAVVERPSMGHIRGLHWIDEEKGKEDLPPAGDILNPEAVTSYIELVYDKFYKNFGEHFGKTILAVFTDEPDPLGRGPRRGIVEGNAKLLPRVNEILGYDFTPHFADLWTENSKDWKKHRNNYKRAITICLEENYYGRLSKWCEDHGIALTGHPAKSMDLGAQKYFQIPGQDLVWRYVEPGPKALDGEHSTMAKNASSAMLHLKRRRNSNELYGAYGHNLTYNEMVWLANWCFVRGHNLLYPHAFYYSIRGARYNERPPDVGPNSAWWDNYKSFADACRRLSWLNTDSEHICEIALLGDANWLPDKSAKVCFQNQLDFNYLELKHLERDVTVNKKGANIAGMTYKAIVLDGLDNLPENSMPVLQNLNKKGHLIIYKNSPLMDKFPNAKVADSPEKLVAAIKSIVNPDLTLQPATTNIRYRHVVKDKVDYYILFNEEETDVSVKIESSAKGEKWWLDEATAIATKMDETKTVKFDAHELKILMIKK